MSSVYAETSAILAWLFGESTSVWVAAAIDGAETVFTSALTALEVRRSLIRAEYTRSITAASSAHLQGVFEIVSRAWVVMEITPEVQSRAALRFPVEPIRSLAAIHLATALELLRVAEDLRLLTLDKRVADNLEPLGIRPVAAM